VRSAPLFILAAVLGRAAPTPMTLVSEAEADPLRSAITRKEVWTQDAARRLRAAADRRLKEGPWSVTFERPRGLDLDPHDYYSEAPNWWPNPEDPGGPYLFRDGRANPDRFSANRVALNSFSDAVFALGTASYLFDDGRYTQRASLLVNTWFVNPKTRMNPNLENAQGVRNWNIGRPEGIIEGRALIRAIQGMEFLQETGAWDSREQSAVRKWFEDYLHWLTQSRNGMEERRSGDDHSSWWTAQVAAVASFVGDDAAARMAFDFYRDRIFPRQIRPDGSAPREEARATPWFSVFNLEAYTMVCRIAEVQGVDLWSVRGKNGATLGTVIDYLKPHLLDPRQWSREQANDLETDALYFLAFAGMGMKKPEYIALYQRLEHPDKAWLSLVDLLVGRWEAAGHQTRH
jgi:Alginate lyase